MNGKGLKGNTSWLKKNIDTQKVQSDKIIYAPIQQERERKNG